MFLLKLYFYLLKNLFLDSVHRWARGGGVGGAPKGKKLFEVDTQGEKGRHPHLDTPKVKLKLCKLTPGVSSFSHFYLVKSPPGGRASGKKFWPPQAGGKFFDPPLPKTRAHL